MLISEDWASIPGNQSKFSVASSKIDNSEDSLINALSCFQKLIDTGNLHPSLNYTCGEIKLIEDIQLEALNLKSTREKVSKN